MTPIAVRVTPTQETTAIVPKEGFWIRLREGNFCCQYNKPAEGAPFGTLMTDKQGDKDSKQL